jgi:hypothetical protein
MITMAKLPEQQARINLQFNEDLADVKTQQLFLGQAVGALVQIVDGLIDRLVSRRLLPEDDPIISDYQKAVEELRKTGLKMEPPEDPDAQIDQFNCPECNAVIKRKPGSEISRCDWCGHQF